MNFAYNANGQRTQKTFTEYGTTVTTTEYLYNGDKLAGQQFSNGKKLTFLYDHNGEYIGLDYNGTEYYYIKNLQGDVIAIADATGTIVGTYTYSAWGEVYYMTGLSSSQINEFTDNIVAINPIRYRGYYYDAETGLYHLNSRYYDPATGRFVNADGFVSTGQGILGNNMFAYCNNDPINRVDPNGMFWKEIGDFFSGIGRWFSNTFGAGSSTVSENRAETSITPILDDPFPITVKTGTKTSQIVSQHGDSTKPISVYAKKDAEHPIKSSSAGLKVNIANFSLKLNLSLDNIGLSGSITEDDTTGSFGLRVNLSELKVGFEGATSIQWDENTSQTNYTNGSISAWSIVAAYLMATTGQPAPSPVY